MKKLRKRTSSKVLGAVAEPQPEPEPEPESVYVAAPVAVATSTSSAPVEVTVAKKSVLMVDSSAQTTVSGDITSDGERVAIETEWREKCSASDQTAAEMTAKWLETEERATALAKEKASLVSKVASAEQRVSKRVGDAEVAQSKMAVAMSKEASAMSAAARAEAQVEEMRRQVETLHASMAQQQERNERAREREQEQEPVRQQQPEPEPEPEMQTQTPEPQREPADEPASATDETEALVQAPVAMNAVRPPRTPRTAAVETLSDAGWIRVLPPTALPKQPLRPPPRAALQGYNRTAPTRAANFVQVLAGTTAVRYDNELQVDLSAFRLSAPQLPPRPNLPSSVTTHAIPTTPCDPTKHRLKEVATCTPLRALVQRVDTRGRSRRCRRRSGARCGWHLSHLTRFPTGLSFR